MAQVGNKVLICMDINELEKSLLNNSFNPNYGIVEDVKKAPNMKEPILTVRGDDGLIYEGTKECFYNQKEFGEVIEQFKDKQKQIIQEAQDKVAKLARGGLHLGASLEKGNAWQPNRTQKDVVTKKQDEMNR